MPNKRSIKPNTYPMITIGTVIDTNDPKQMGRSRIQCKSLGDTDDKLVRNIPWATYISPLAGVMSRGSRGREDDVTVGPVAYGMWNIPKVGALALVACLDGDPSQRVYFGQLHGDLLNHTLPHGRFSVQGIIPEVSDESFFDLDQDSARPLGPFNSREEAIQPQYDKLVEAFTHPDSPDTLNLTPVDIKPQRNFEYYTRGADKSVSRLSSEDVFDNNVLSFARDDLDDPFLIDTTEGGELFNSTQGYQQSRVEPNAISEATDKVYDSQIYSWTTPGLHAIAMDDSADNCRLRFRTTHGHQVILDDTNERIYISTAGGKTWIEMDEQGNIDFYAERNISFHAKKDINFTTDKSFRVKAKEGIHLASEGEMRLHTKLDDMHITSDKSIRMHSIEETRIQALGNLHIDTASQSFITAATQMDVKVAGGTMYLEVSADIDAKAGADVKIEATSNFNTKAGADVKIEATSNFNVKAGATGNVDAGGTLNLKAGGAGNFDAGGVASVKAGSNVLITGAQVHANGPPASAASAADSAAPGTGSTPAGSTVHKEAWWTNRIPEHEPWPRAMTAETGPNATDNDGPSAPTNTDSNTHQDASEYSEANGGEGYKDQNIGKVERGDPLPRNNNWKR